MADPASLDTKKPKAFTWLGDPAANLRGKGKTRITAGQMQQMDAYNRRLITPLDRGGGQDIRINGAPPRLARAQAPVQDRMAAARVAAANAQTQSTTISDAAGIGARYATPGVVNPNLIAAAPAPTAPVAAPVAATTTNPNVSPSAQPTSAPVANPNLPVAAPAGGMREYGPEDNPYAPRALTAEETGGTPPDFVRNPNTNAPTRSRSATPMQDEAMADWMSRGGSAATFHRAQVAAGLRAPIDAHAIPDPQGSTASSEIQQSHGWSGQGPEVDASQIAKQMTGEFNANNAKSQADWKSRFTDAHAALMQSLNNN